MQTTLSPGAILRVAFARRMAATGRGRDLRVEHRLSGAEMAGALGVSPATLWRWEQGQRVPQGDAAVRYADLLDELMAQDGATE